MSMLANGKITLLFIVRTKDNQLDPKKGRKELTRFLGTIAHDYNWAPLTYTNWQKVPNKDKIWEFVNQAMRQLEALQDEQSSESRKDSFDEVIGNARRSSKLLLGLGTARKKLKKKGTSDSLILPEEIMEHIKSVVIADVQKDISAEKEELAKEKESHATQVAAEVTEMQRKSEELELEALKLQEMRREFETQQKNITFDVIASTLAQLLQKDPSLTPKMIAKAIVSTATNGV